MAGRFTIETHFKGVDNTSGVISGIERRVKGMERALAGPGRFADKSIGAIKQVGAAMAYTGVAAVGAGMAFAQAIAPGADFDQQMSAVGAVSLMTRDQVADLETTARQLGRTTRYSATEVAGGMEMMGKAGFDNAQIIAGIGPILAASAAEGAEFAETTSIISNVMKGMGLQMSETARVADVLTLASAKTNSSISSLGESMAIVAPTARQLHVPLEEAVAAVAMLQDRGLDASVAGSAVATMLTNLSKPTAAIASKMHAMGVSFQDAHGDMLPFREVVGQLAKAGQKAGGNMAQVAFFADLVGLRGQKAALNLKDLTPELAKLSRELDKAAGSAEKMAALKLDNFKGDMTLLGNLATDVGIDFFDLVKGPLRAAAQGTREWLADNQDLLKSDVGGWVKGITDNVGSMRQGLEKGVAILDNFKDGLSGAFEDSNVIKLGSALSGVFGDSKTGPRQRAYEFGHALGTVGIDIISFIGLVKGAQAAVGLFELATKGAKAVKWTWELGSAAFEAARGFAALQLSPGGIIALGSKITDAAGAAGKLSAVRTVVNDVFDGWASKAGLAAAAIYSVYKAYEQAAAFGNENGGWEGAKAMVGLSDKTNNWGFQGIDDVLNDQAREQAARDNAGKVSFIDTTEGAPLARAYDKIANPVTAPQLGAPGGYAAAFGFGAGTPAAAPQVAPQVASPRNDGSSAELISTNRQLQDMVKQLTSKIGATSGTLKIMLPKGATGEVSGAPGVEVNQSGGF